MTKSLLENLKLECENCTQCELSKTRNNVVFSDGNPETAKIILIGEAPGENEDLQGKPFVGRAGKLLNEFLLNAGIDRQRDLYIINTVKCRPPKNRVPSLQEKSACEHFLFEQIDLINPSIILLCGATAMKSFLDKKLAISKVRGNIFEIEVKNKKYKAMPIFHPSYLLRNHSLDVGSPRDLTLNDLKFAFDYKK
ncbi:uracil-DNA glycosylase [bacterium]|nr:uracil-DNA glycosylase [bacterium]